jgi:hypothetical protein
VAANYYHNIEHIAYRAATVHRDLIDLAEKEQDNNEMWLIGSGNTVNATASNEGTKNVNRSKRHMKVGNGVTCHIAGQGEIMF